MAKLTRDDAKKLHQKLKDKISYHDHLYYVLDKPEISDFDYDQLFQKLVDLESAYDFLDTQDSPTQRVGGSPLPHFNKVNHRLPMLSLSNTYSSEEILDFDQRLKKFLKNESELEYYCEPKFDGLAIELVYESGFLVRALTRGDGTTGEDVTQNIKTIKSIPLRLRTNSPPKLFEVRGEVLIFKKDFLVLNQEQDEAGEQSFANPRNAAAGTVRQLDPKIAASRPLRFFAYALGAAEGVSFATQQEIGDYFLSCGLPVADRFDKMSLRHVCLGPGAAIDYYHSLEKIRSKLPFDIDGCVIRVNSLSLQDDLGLVARSPRWATAAKYKPEQAQTVVENIVVQVGRTGVLTPVAIMKPTKVGGVTVTNATLHNQEELLRKDVRIGDTVIIQRAGDVIPEIVSVVLDKRARGAKEFLLPNHCPVCDEPVEKVDDEVATRCVNPTCPAIIKGSLIHFVSRRAMNIDKVGDRLVEVFVDAGLVKSFSDFYKLKKEQILALDRQGEKSAQNIIDSINASRNPTLARFIYALGIRFVGEQTAKSLADHFATIENFMDAKEGDLVGVPDIGPKVATAIVRWSKNTKIQSEIHKLLKELRIQNPKRNLSGPLSGLSFLITGTLPVKRDEAKDLIEQSGGKILSSVSAKLDYLVVGDDPGSKVEKAQSLQVKMISWDELQSLLKSRS